MLLLLLLPQRVDSFMVAPITTRPHALCAGSLVLQNAQERHFAGGLFCDLPMGGVYMVRGENLALLGEIVSWRALWAAALAMLGGCTSAVPAPVSQSFLAITPRVRMRPTDGPCRTLRVTRATHF